MNALNEETGLARADGVAMLAQMPEETFETRLVQLKRGQDRLREIHRSVMIEGVDFGVIPNTGDKPSLLKSGAEKLAFLYGLMAEFDNDIRFGDGESAPHVTVISTCFLHRGDRGGPIVGMGTGARSTWESKYRYRNSDRHCPACGAAGSIRRSKYENKQTGQRDWYCFEKAGGCNAQFPHDAPEIVTQTPGKVPNHDAPDLLNTIVKMAQKSALVDATLRVTATSGLYTQDVEDMHDAPSPMPIKRQERSTPEAPAALPPARTTRGKAAAPKGAVECRKLTDALEWKNGATFRFIGEHLGRQITKAADVSPDEWNSLVVVLEQAVQNRSDVLESKPELYESMFSIQEWADLAMNLACQPEVEVSTPAADEDPFADESSFE